MKKYSYIILVILMILCGIILLSPAMPVTFDKTVSENRILMQYDISGCGSLIRKVIDGGEKISEKLKDECPSIADNEVMFTNDSDEPEKHMDSADFYTAGLAEKYTYIIEGEVTGITNGASDCCDADKYAYNEFVPEFKVTKW